MKARVSPALVMVAGMLLLGVAAWWWRQQPAPRPEPLAEAPAPVPVPAPAVPVPPPVRAAAPEPPVPEPAPEPRPLLAGDLQQALIDALGARTVKAWLQLDDFPRRVVATVDNLGRDHAPAMRWPVEPTPGRFKVIEHEGRTVVDPDNQLRYAPFVTALEQIDPAAAAALYGRLLPLLQPAYEELGFPGRRFHDRLVQVLDLLLAAPAAPEYLDVTLTEVKGPVPSLRPWVRYQYADPAYEAAPAGQKLMLRVGAPNQRRLEAWLRKFRRALLERAAR